MSKLGCNRRKSLTSCVFHTDFTQEAETLHPQFNQELAVALKKSNQRKLEDDERKSHKRPWRMARMSSRKVYEDQVEKKYLDIFLAGYQRLLTFRSNSELGTEDENLRKQKASGNTFW